MTERTPTGATPTIVQRLRQIPLFTQLDDGELERIGRAARDKNYPKGSVILFEDDPGDALYVVLSGQVKVVLIGEDGREVILSMLKVGDFFGEMSLIDDQPRSAHVIAVDDAGLRVELHRIAYDPALTIEAAAERDFPMPKRYARKLREGMEML